MKGVGEIRAEPLIPPMDQMEGSRMEEEEEGEEEGGGGWRSERREGHLGDIVEELLVLLIQSPHLLPLPHLLLQLREPGVTGWRRTGDQVTDDRRQVMRGPWSTLGRWRGWRAGNPRPGCGSIRGCANITKYFLGPF